MTDFIFLGPSLPRAEASTILDAEYLPPVAMGDLYTLVRTRARPGDRIAIIDGLFEQVPAVWHKEVLFAIESGIAVYGASSMGALRAAELHPFGMRGVGRIFEAYRDGLIEDDDEVVVAHATEDQGYRALSHAMVSLRFGLASLVDQGVLSAAEAERLAGQVKQQHYSARSWAAVFAVAKAQGYSEAALAAIRTTARSYDAKADDARTLLRLLAAERVEAPVAPSFVLEQTSFWIALTQSQEGRIAASEAGPGLTQSDREIARHLRAASPDRDSVLERASLMRLAAEHTRDWTPAPADLMAAAFRIARGQRLQNARDLRDWRAENDLDDEGKWATLLDLEARAELLIHHLVPGLDRFILAAAKRDGRYAEAQAHAVRANERFGLDRIKRLSLEDSGVAPEALEAWYQKRFGPMLPDPETHAGRLGFETLRDLIAELLPAYLLDQPSAQSAAVG